MSESIKTEQDLKQAFSALWDDLDEKLDALREEFRRDMLRDIMALVIAKRDENAEPAYFQEWFAGLMGEAADTLSRTDLSLGKTYRVCRDELWEMLAEEIGDLVPSAERGAWFAQATDNGGWVEFDPDLVFRAA
ncbi:MAG: hypothetical protein IKZ87_00230 [Actinomycetaceae bacterium]|nr:hypothetical protein [Actinomycetaceae bacterium]